MTTRGNNARKASGKTRKLIDLPNDVCTRLAVEAAATGTSVKRLIEDLIISTFDKTSDEAIFAYLCMTEPDGAVMVSDEEQTEFEQWLNEHAE